MEIFDVLDAKPIVHRIGPKEQQTNKKHTKAEFNAIEFRYSFISMYT